MAILIGGVFLMIVVFGFILWLGSAVQSKQQEAAPVRRSQPSAAREPSAAAPSGGHTRTVQATPRQRAQAAQVQASERAITTARRKGLKGLPKGTVHYERIKPVSYEGRTVNAMCLNDQGEITGYVDLAAMPLDWE